MDALLFMIISSFFSKNKIIDVLTFVGNIMNIIGFILHGYVVYIYIYQGRVHEKMYYVLAQV